MASASPQKWAEEDMPPPQHQQQQHTHAGPDQEVVEVKQLLRQALGGAGILNHARVRFRQAMQSCPTSLAHHENAHSRHPPPLTPNRLCLSQGFIWPRIVLVTGSDPRPVSRIYGFYTPINARWP